MRIGLLLAGLTVALTLSGVAAARPAPVTWCGADEVTADRVPNLDVSSTAQIRLVYATPSDGPDNFLADASGIATDGAWIDQWWQGQDPTRTPRFDRYPFAGCTSPFGALDIGFVRLPHPGSYYASADDPGELLDLDLQNTVAGTEKTIVYYDGPERNRLICGETGYLSETRGGQYGIAYVFLGSECGLAPGSGPSAEVAAHELLHNLGAVPDAAPHECPDSASHVCDSTTDVLYPFLSDGSTLDGVVLDFGRDDYYGHSGAWWDVQDSMWLTHLPQFPITLSIAGSGTLAAIANSAVLPCTAGCSVSLDNGIAVTITARPAPGQRLEAWSGACAGTAPTCTVTMTQAMSATAAFVPTTMRVAVAVRGKGTVTSSPAGIRCPGTCTRVFSGIAAVHLVARPAAGWRFAGWSGACRGTHACRVSGRAGVGARFVRK